VEPPPAKIELPPAQDLLFRPIPAAPLPELPPVSIVEAPKPAAPEPREVDEYPLVFTRASAFGETPMLRNWKMLAVYSLTVVVVSQPAPVVAQDKAVGERLDKLEASLKKSFEDLGLDIKSLTGDVGSVKNQLTKLQADITSLQTESLGNKLKIDTLTGKLESLEGQVSKLHKEVDGLRKRLDLDLTHVGSSPIDKLAIEELRSKLAGIEKAILGLTPPASRTVLSPGVVPVVPTVSGRVMLINNYPEELLFVLNGKSFRVPAMTTQPIEGVPVGSLSYEVVSPTWGLRARRTTALGASETFTLTAQ